MSVNMTNGRRRSGRPERRNWLSSWLALSVAMLLVLTACASDTAENGDDGGASTESPEGDSTASGEGPLIIGDASSRTGFASGYDIPANVGFRLKIEELNAEGGLLGRQIEVVSADSRSEPEASGDAALEVLEGGAEVMLVACDYDVGAPAAVIAQEQNVASFAACAGSTKFGPLGIGPLAFTMATPSPTMGAIMAEWAYDQGYRAAYVLEDTSIDYSKQLCAGFRQRWTEVAGDEALVGSDTFTQGDASIATQITGMQNAETTPDVIFPCSYNPGLASVLKQIRDAGVDTPILGDASLDGEEWKAAVAGLSDVYFPTYGSIYGDDPEPAVNEFFEAYEAEVGEPAPTSYPLTGYSVMEAFHRAIEAAGTTAGAEVAAALEAFEDEPLLVGPTSFNEEFHLDLYRPMRVMEIQDGETSFLTVWEPESVSVPET